MGRFSAWARRPHFLFGVLLPLALVVEFLVLEGFVGVSFPSERGSAVSTYEIKNKDINLHFITRNKRFSIVDVWSKPGTALEAVVLRETSAIDRQAGVEGAKSAVTVEALNGRAVRWTFEEPGETGRALDHQVYVVTKYGCCGAPNTYSYFSLRDGKKLLSTHHELNPDELAALEKPLYE